MDERPSLVRRRQRRKEGTSEVDHLKDLAHRVTMKIEEGDVRGAVHLASSEDVLTEYKEIYHALQSKHPSAHPNSHIPSPSSDIQFKLRD